MHPLTEILTRRILRLNCDFALAKFEGRDTKPFLRRAKSLSAVWLQLQREGAA